MLSNNQQSAREKVKIYRAFDKILVCEDRSIFKAIPEVQGMIQGTLQGLQEIQGGISDFQGLQSLPGLPNQYGNLEFQAFGEDIRTTCPKLYSALCYITRALVRYIKYEYIT